MAILTALDDGDLASVARAFGLGPVRGEGILAGSVNTNYRLDTERGERLFLRVYEEQDVEGALRDVRLVGRLAAEGVPTPAPRERVDGGGAIFVLRGKACAVTPWIDGAHRCQATVREDDVAKVGAALAGVHAVGERFDANDALTGPSRFDLAALRARLARVDASSAEVASAVARVGAVLDDVETRPAPARELPLVHGDLFRDNVLFTDRGAILLDFESASRGRAAFDVAVTMLAWCFGDGLDSSLCRAFASGYSAGRNLAAAEATELFDAARLACARFTTTRLTDYEQRPRGLGVYKDFRRWIRRLDAVEAIGREAFPQAFGFG